MAKGAWPVSARADLNSDVDWAQKKKEKKKRKPTPGVLSVAAAFVLSQLPIEQRVVVVVGGAPGGAFDGTCSKVVHLIERQSQTAYGPTPIKI